MFIVILFVITVLVLFCWRDSRKPENFPPGPAWLPLIGALPLVKQLHSCYNFYHLVWNHLAQRYGSVVGVRLGSQYLVIISGLEAIKEAYSYEEFDGRPDGFTFLIRTFGQKIGVVLSEGKLWEEQRKFALRNLKQLGMGKYGMVEHVQREASALVDFFRQKALNKELVVMTHAFDISVLNVTWALLAGHRFDLEDDRLGHFMQMIHNSFRMLEMSGGILDQFPYFRYIFPEKTGYADIMRNVTPIWTFLKDIISKINENMIPDETNSLIEAFLKKMHTIPPTKNFTEAQLLSVCLDFFQAGFETTSNTISFGILYMLHNPDIRKKVSDELNSIVGRNRLPNLNDRSSLKYVEAVLCEIQRHANIAPLAIAHKTMKKVNLQNYTIPKNTTSLISLYSIHMDKAYWKDPHVFRPERFLDENGKIIQHEYFLPFGSGKRRCMGENFAKSSFFLFFTSFLHSFDFEVPADEKIPDLKGLDGLTISPKPFKLYLHLKE